jgi:hypothetical protein
MNKKIAVLFLVMCIVGFSMSPVNARDHHYLIEGKVGDVFEFDECINMGPIPFGETSYAYDESGLFEMSDSVELLDGRRNYHYTCLAVEAGHKTIKISPWEKNNHTQYEFNITKNITK